MDVGYATQGELFCGRLFLMSCQCDEIAHAYGGIWYVDKYWCKFNRDWTSHPFYRWYIYSLETLIWSPTWFSDTSSEPSYSQVGCLWAGTLIGTLLTLIILLTERFVLSAILDFMYHIQLLVWTVTGAMRKFKVLSYFGTCTIESWKYFINDLIIGLRRYGHLTLTCDWTWNNRSQ